MAFLKFLLSLLIVTLSLSSLCFQDALAEDFDFFTLALYRTATVCGQSPCCIRGYVPQREFIIHGLWPDYDNGSWPQCCTGPDFEMDQLLPIHAKLQVAWPSISCEPYTSCNGQEDLIVWQREWEMHGKCASPVLNDLKSYYEEAILLYQRYDVDRILSQANIGSNEVTYPLDNVIGAIKNSLSGASPIVICQNDALKEVRLCFEKYLLPRPCSIVTNYSCPENIYVPIVGSSVIGGKNAAKKKAFNPITLNVA